MVYWSTGKNYKNIQKPIVISPDEIHWTIISSPFFSGGKDGRETLGALDFWGDLYVWTSR